MKEKIKIGQNEASGKAAVSPTPGSKLGRLVPSSGDCDTGVALSF